MDPVSSTDFTQKTYMLGGCCVCSELGFQQCVKNSFSQLETFMCLVVQVVSLGSILTLKSRERRQEKEREKEREREKGRGMWMFVPIRNEWVLFSLMLGHGRQSHITQK